MSQWCCDKYENQSSLLEPQKNLKFRSIVTWFRTKILPVSPEHSKPLTTAFPSHIANGAGPYSHIDQINQDFPFIGVVLFVCGQKGVTSLIKRIWEKHGKTFRIGRYAHDGMHRSSYWSHIPDSGLCRALLGLWWYLWCGPMAGGPL